MWSSGDNVDSILSNVVDDNDKDQLFRTRATIDSLASGRIRSEHSFVRCSFWSVQKVLRSSSSRQTGLEPDEAERNA